MASHHATQPRLASEIRITDLEMWTVAQFATVLGRREDWVRDRIDGDVIRLPGCVTVPINRDAQSTHRVIYAAQWRHAVLNAPAVLLRWDANTQTAVEEPA